VCKHIHAVVQLCGIVAVGSNSETHSPEPVVNVTEQQSVDDLNDQPVLSSLRAAEMSMLLKAGCLSTDDSEKGLKEIDELMNSIRGSLAGDQDPNVIAITKEGLKTVIAQITAAKQHPVINLELPPVIHNEPANKRQVKQLRFESTKVKASTRSKLSLRKPSRAEKLSIVTALEGKDLLVSRAATVNDHTYLKDCQQEFEHSYTRRPNEITETTATKCRRLLTNLRRSMPGIQFFLTFSKLRGPSH